MRTKKFLAMAIALGLAVGMTAMPTLAAEKKTLVFGDTTFNAENEEADINPQNTYAGWACIRYGVGETLFRYSDTMEIEPWIAKEYENIDELTWKITLNDGVVFSNGRACDGEAVKESLEALVANHERAAGDLCIDTIEADGNTVTIKTTEPKPALINYLSDPYGCIIDMQAGISDDGIVIGTGPYVATELVTDDHVNLVKNENYWNGDVNVDEITVRTISDGDTLAMALQAGEINAAYGMAYASYPLFENDDFTFTSTATSRAFYAWMNFESPVTSDPAVRKAIAMGIDKDSFVSVLLNGYGYPAVGVFPDTFSFGGQNLTTESYDPDGAKKVLEEAGWVDSDGDGIREKDGQKLEIRWLTYPSRQELPLLAESAQATLKEIGMDVQINCTSDNNTIRKDPALWDVYASAMRLTTFVIVTRPTFWLNEVFGRTPNSAAILEPSPSQITPPESSESVASRPMPPSITPEISPTVSTAVTMNMISTGTMARRSKTRGTGISFGMENQEASATLSQFKTHALVYSTPSAVMPVGDKKRPMTADAIYPAMIPIRMDDALVMPFVP